jgi:hypothetical protein
MTITEIIIPAKPDHHLYFLDGRGDLCSIDVIAWAIKGQDRPIPITAAGRFDERHPYVFGDGRNFIAPNDGLVLQHSPDAAVYLRKRADVV